AIRAPAPTSQSRRRQCRSSRPARRCASGSTAPRPRRAGVPEIPLLDGGAGTGACDSVRQRARTAYDGPAARGRNSMDQRCEELLHDRKVTRGCRINAAERLNTRVRRMALLIAVAAGMVIALTVLPALYKLPPAISIDLEVVTLLMAVVILAVSLFQY